MNTQPILEWMTFYLAQELYGVDILAVKEIRSPTLVTKIPLSSTEVMGAINLRGDIVPIIDLRRRLGLADIDDTTDTVFIILQYLDANKTKTLGIRVDSVADVVHIEPKDTDFRSQTDHASCVQALAESKQGSVALLSVAQLLQSDALHRNTES